MNEETLSKVFSFIVTVVIIGFALAVNTFIRNALTGKEDSLKVKKISLFHQGEIFYCKNRSLRHKINNQDWTLENDKFVNNKDGYFYYLSECKIENVD